MQLDYIKNNFQTEPIKDEVQELVETGKDFEIQDMESYKKAGDYLKLVKDRIKEIKKQRKSYTKPLDQVKKSIIADVREILEPLKKQESLIKERMKSFWKEEKKKRDKKQKELEEKAKKKLKKENKSEVEVEVVNDIKTERGQKSTTTIKEYWTYKIKDVKKIPKKYLKPDKGKIRKAVNKGQRKIPGIKIYKKESVSVR